MHKIIITLQRANINYGQSVLINTGGSCFGLAAINIAQYYQSDIYITTTTTKERTFIKKLFPTIKGNHPSKL